MSPEKEISHIERDRLFLGPVEAVCDPHIIKHCLDKYENHPKGCPNWGHKEGCPPNVRHFSRVYAKEVFVVAIRFNFAAYLSLRRQAHPNWTDRALKNPRHWQGHLRHELNDFLFKHLSEHEEIDGEIILSPEAMGVDLFATCENVGIHLERNPQNYVYKVALIARKLNENRS